MTRHGMIQSQVVGAQSPAPDPRLSMVIINADRAAASRVPGRQHRLEGASKRPVGIHLRPPWRGPRHRRHLPKSEIPIAIACGPRVPSSGTFVRLPAPETLHASGQPVFWMSGLESGPSRKRMQD